MVFVAQLAAFLAFMTVDATMLWPPTLDYHMVDPVFTPYYDNGTVNLEVIPAYSRLCSKNGVDVVLLGGSTAEWPSLTADERLDLLSAWRKALDTIPKARRPQLIFHAGDVNIPAAQHLASQSKVRGADAILIVAPCIMKPGSMHDLVSSIKAVADKAPDLPSMYYHYPELYGVAFPMDEFAEAASREIPTFAGVKYIDSDMTTLINATGVGGGKLTFFNNDPLLVGMAAGSKGAISYTTVFPFIRRMHDLFAAGKLDDARQLQRKLFEYGRIISKYGDAKAAARALPEIFDASVKLGPPRAPLSGLPAAALPKLAHDLRTAGFLTPGLLTV